LYSTPFKAGHLTGSILTFEGIGDTLPVHMHDEAGNHITLIMNGSFKCIGNPHIEGTIMTVGQVIIWPPNEPHGFIALEPNSRMLQVATKPDL